MTAVRDLFDLPEAAPHDDYAGQSPAQYFEAFLNAECQSLGLTHDDLRNWRPPEKQKRGKARKRKVE